MQNIESTECIPNRGRTDNSDDRILNNNFIIRSWKIPAKYSIVYVFILYHCLLKLLPNVSVVWLLVEVYVSYVF